MKRIAIISLALVFLTTNLTYVTAFPIEKLYQAIEKAQKQELTQEEVEELVIAVLDSIDWEGIVQNSPSVAPETIEPTSISSCYESGLYLLNYLPELIFMAFNPFMWGAVLYILTTAVVHCFFG